MAQKREKEETELKVPESLPLCSSTLSLTAPPPPQHLSAADISDLKLTALDESRSNSGTSPEIVDPKFSSSESRSSSATTLESIYPKLLGIDELRSSSAASPESIYPKLLGIDELRSSSAASLESTDRKAAVKRPREASRCSGTGCRRKVGLMPFRCRCGEVFCSEHRYSDRHDCSYDYKAAGREAIARENPVVKAAKILKV